MKILVLNAGSSSQKSCLYDVPDGALPGKQPAPLWTGEIDGTELKISTRAGVSRQETLATAPSDTTSHLLQTLWSGPTQVISHPGEIDIVGHRVVHGGSEYKNPTLITEEVKTAIRRLSPLAPAHNPAALAGMEAIEHLLGDVPQVAVFDTAFHRSLPDAAAFYPVPYEWQEQGIRRFGFHGISHEDCAQRAARILGRELSSLRLITCHLGNGCSLAAIQGGRSMDTTMGFTPLEGLMMGTRSGSIDPGILLYLMREKGYNANQLDHILNKESGLKGISGLSGDMRDITAAMDGEHKQAQLAFDMYVHRLRSGIGAMLGALGGLDALVFTAGVGENSAPIRAGVCQQFAWMGLRIDANRNEGSPVDEDIALPESAVRVLVIQAQEDWAVARVCRSFVL
ncbi:acetate kinase [bacterium]|nr:MAG: acetate kinase [bacterium]